MNTNKKEKAAIFGQQLMALSAIGMNPNRKHTPKNLEIIRTVLAAHQAGKLSPLRRNNSPKLSPRPKTANNLPARTGYETTALPILMKIRKIEEEIKDLTEFRDLLKAELKKHAIKIKKFTY